MNVTRQVLITVILAAVFFELSDEKNRNRRRRRRRLRTRKKIGGRPRANVRRTIGGRSRRTDIRTVNERSAPRRSGRTSTRRSGANTRRRIRGRGRNLIRGPRRGRRPGQNRLTYAPMKHAVTELPPTNGDMVEFDDDFKLPKQFCPCATGEPEYNEEWEKSHSRWLFLTND